MLGWEFPPFFVGGVGMVCYEICEALGKYSNVEVEYVMAYGPKKKTHMKNVTISSANLEKLTNVNITQIPSLLYSYDSAEEYSKKYQSLCELELECSESKNPMQLYGRNLIQEVYLYAKRVASLYKNSDFDVIHAHDWTTVPAALLLKKLTGKPVIVHVHITELDKTGGNGGYEEVFKIERMAFQKADCLVCVSNFVRNRLINDYGVDPNKARVIHNGKIGDISRQIGECNHILKKDKIVLFAGRMTLQKGPEYFIRAAKKVLEYEPNTKFIVAGGGDMLGQIIEYAAHLGIGKNVFFHGGSYSREDAIKYFSIADIFVMPSVSEPFGVVPLEAIARGTPTIISKQSGISEVLTNTFKVDFWDTDEIAHKILALIRYPHLHNLMREEGSHELDKFSWDKPAKKIVDTYLEFTKR